MVSYYELFWAPENRTVTLKLIRYSLWMILFPLVTFYFTYYIMFDGDKSMIGWSGIAAVVVANMVIADYIRMAWYEDEDEEGVDQTGVDQTGKGKRVKKRELKTD
jgi:hypothetical protein